MPSKSLQKDDVDPRKIRDDKKESKKRKRKKKKEREVIETDFFSTFSLSGTKIVSHITSHCISVTISQGRDNDCHFIDKKAELQDFIDLLHPLLL